MIEIIREEDWEGTEKKTLPKDIKQIGRPDIGDRIYVENQVYQFLHPCRSGTQKAAYVLLGRFENYAGRQCTFVEAAIRLDEVKFDAELPVWNDDTWAYIYRQLKHEFDSMVIVGWALDHRGKLPKMTERTETLHRNHFGGEHQILLLMDTLEREEVFYGNRAGHLGEREGFYIYYDRKTAAVMSHTAQASVEEAETPERPWPDGREAETTGWKDEAFFAADMPGDGEKEAFSPERSGEEEREALWPETPGYRERPALWQEMPGDGGREDHQPEVPERADEKFCRAQGAGEALQAAEKRDHGTPPEAEAEKEPQDNGALEADAWEREKWEDVRRREEAEKGAFRAQAGWGAHTGRRKSGRKNAVWGKSSPQGGNYRREVFEHEEGQGTSSYASSVLLLAVVCALGVTAYLNHQKMNEMEETIARMNNGRTVATEQSTETIKIEEVAGNVKKQEPVQTGAEGSVNPGGGKPEATEQTDTKEAGNTGADIEEGREGDGTKAAENRTGETEQGAQADSAESEGKAEADTQEQDTQTQEEGDTEQAEQTAAMEEAQTYLQQGYYIVQKGDSLVGICRKVYQTTAMMDKLCEANGIEDPNAIYAGQYLTLPH